MSIQSITTSFNPAQEAYRGSVSDGAVAAKAAQAPQSASKQAETVSVQAREARGKDAKPAEMAKELTKVAQKLGSELSFSVDKDLNRVVVTVTDLDTKEVIRQIPSEEMLALARRLRAVEDGGDVKGLIFGSKG